MTKHVSTKRALILSLLSMLLCISMLVGSTYAWFTDTATTAVNKIQAGTLDVALQMKDNDGNWVSAEGKTLQFLVEGKIPAEGTKILWEPGCTYSLPDLRVVNNGNLALKYKLVITGINGSAELNEVIDWTITLDGTDYVVGTEHHLAAKTAQTVDADILTVKGHMQETAGNEYQNMSISDIAIMVLATQDTVESDSYGNQYDAGAVYPVYSAASMKEALDEINNSEEIHSATLELSQNFEYTNELLEVKNNKNIKIDLAGNNLKVTNTSSDGISVINGTLTLANSGASGKYTFDCAANGADGIFVSNTEEGKTSVLNIEGDVELIVDASANSAIHAYAPAGNAIVNMDGAKVSIKGSEQISGLVIDQNATLNLSNTIFEVNSDFDRYSDNNDVVGILAWGQNGKQENIGIHIGEGTVIKVGGKNAFAQGIQIAMKNGYSENVNVTMDGGEIILNQTENGTGYAFTVYKGVYGTFTVNGGSVSGNVTALELAYIGPTQLIINGGIFNVNPSNYLGEGHTATENNGVWTVR